MLRSGGDRDRSASPPPSHADARQERARGKAVAHITTHPAQPQHAAPPLQLLAFVHAAASPPATVLAVAPAAPPCPEAEFRFFSPKYHFVFSSFFTQIFTYFHRKSLEIHQHFDFRMVSSTNVKTEIFDTFIEIWGSFKRIVLGFPA